MNYTERLEKIAVAAMNMVEELGSLTAEVRHGVGFATEDPDPIGGQAGVVVRTLESAGARAHELSQVLDKVVASWRRANRFSDSGLAATLSRLSNIASDDVDRARHLLLDEISAALHALAVDHAVQLLHGTEVWSGVPLEVVEDLRAWRDGDDGRGFHGVQLLRGRSSDRTRDRRPRPRSVTLALTEVWLRQRLGDTAGASALLDELVELAPTDAFVHVERAGMSLLAGNAEAAGEESHRAIELDPTDPRAYAQAGAVAETVGDYTDAMELYGEASRRLPGSSEMVASPAWASFLRLTGLFLLSRARTLHDYDLRREALAAADKALAEGIAGAATYPDADAYELRWHLLRDLGASEDQVTEAAFEAGKRHLWNGDLQRARDALDLATTAGGRLPDAGWYRVASLVPAEETSAPELFRAAASAWDDWRERVGPPSPTTAWAYATRALLGDLIASVDDGDSGPPAWQGVVLCEKGLVLNPRDAAVWAALCRSFRILTLNRLALDAVEAGYLVNPDDVGVLSERVAVLADAGRTQEALVTWDRISDAAKDPWLSGVKAFLLQQLGQAAEALKYLDLPLSGSWDLGWYRDVRAGCYVDLGRLDEALDDLRALLSDESRWSGQARARRIYAWSVLGDLPEARTELRAALDDQTMALDAKELAGAIVALISDDLATAREKLMQAIRGCTNAVAVADIVRTVDRLLVLKQHIGQPVSGGEELSRELAQATAAWALEESSAEDDIRAALKANEQEPPTSSARIALTAIQARRRLKEEPDAASRLYERLVGSGFDPESRVALAQALDHAYRGAVRRGDVERTRDYFDRLRALDHAPVPFVEVAVAEALRAKGQYRKAVTTLSDRLPHVTDVHDRVLVLGLLGESALFAGQADLAESALEEAFALATRADNHSLAAQVAVRMAVAAAVAFRPFSVPRHLARALDEWSAAGAWDRMTILRQELSWVLDAMPGMLPTALVKDVVLTAVNQLAPAVDRAHGAT